MYGADARGAAFPQRSVRPRDDRCDAAGTSPRRPARIFVVGKVLARGRQRRRGSDRLGGIGHEAAAHPLATLGVHQSQYEEVDAEALSGHGDDVADLRPPRLLDVDVGERSEGSTGVVDEYQANHASHDANRIARISLPRRTTRLRMPTWRILRPTTRSRPTASTSPTRRWGPASRRLVWQTDWPGNIDFEWDDQLAGMSFLRELASFTRVITHDQRGIGLSSRTSRQPIWRPERRICGSCWMPPGRIAWSCAVSTTREASTRCSRRRIRSGCIRSCGSRPRREPRGYPTTPGGQASSIARPRMRRSRCGARPYTAPPTSSTRTRSATRCPRSSATSCPGRAATPAPPMSRNRCRRTGTRSTCGRSCRRSDVRRSC